MQTNLFFEVLTNLFEQWIENATYKEIRDDYDKIDLMTKVRDEILASGEEPPEHVVKFYSGVFLRDEFCPRTPPGTSSRP